MASKLALRQYIPLPPHPAGDFDHGDVYLPTGRVFIANTAAGTVEVVAGGAPAPPGDHSRLSRGQWCALCSGRGVAVRGGPWGR
jgi:hypothetical protein